MTTELQNEPSGRRRSIKRRTAWLATMAMIVVIVGVAFEYYTDPERVRRVVEAQLTRIVGGAVVVGRAELSFTRGLELYDVHIDVDAHGEHDLPGVDENTVTNDTEQMPGHEPAFSCKRIDLRYDLWTMLLGRLEILSLSATEPTCTIVHETATGRTNISRIFQRLSTIAKPVTGRVSLPIIELRDARVRVMARNSVGTRQVEDLRLTFRGRPAQRDPNLYDIVWHDASAETPGGYSQLDLSTGYVRNVRGGLPGMSIEAVMLAINARYDGVGAWNRLLGLGGRVRARDYNLIGSPDGTGRSVTIDLNDATISIPINEFEQSLPRTQRYLRFEAVDGTIIATTQALVADFAGSLHGASCKVKAILQENAGELRSLEDVGFDVHLAVVDFTIPRDDPDSPPEEARFVTHFEHIADNVHTFDPHGRVNIDVHLTKQTGADEGIRLERALVTLRGTDVSFEHFPYRGYNISGEIEITPDGVTIRGIQGEHDGAVIHVDGWMAKPSRCAPGTFTIVGKNVPIDDDLFHALRPDHKETALSFSPRGRVNVDVDLKRGACVGDETRAIWSSMVDINLAGAMSATYEHFPYPIDGLTGHVIIGQDRARVVDVEGRSGADGRGRVRVAGEIGFGAQQVDSVELVVEGVGIDIDTPLIGALPPALGDRLRALHPTGRFDVTTRIGLAPDSRRLVHESDVQLRGISVKSEAFPLLVADIVGPLRITQDRVTTTGLTGHSGAAAITLRGSIDPAAPERGAEVFASCQNVTLDHKTLSLLPIAWRDRLNSWRIESPLDLELDIRSASSSGSPVNVSGAARLADAIVAWKNSDFRLEGVYGEVAFDRADTRGVGITGRCGDAPFRASFEFSDNAPDARGVVSLTAESVPLGDATRAMLPPRFQAAWDRIKPEGYVDVDIKRLAIGRPPDDPSGYTGCELDATVTLHDVSLRAPDTPKRMSGELTVTGTLVDRLGGTILQGDATLTELKLLDRDFKDVDAVWSLVQTVDGRGRFEAKQLQASLYGGSVAGDLELNAGADQSTYRLSATLQDVDFNPFVNSGRAFVDADGGPADVSGRLNVHLYMSGLLGDRASRRGGGQVQIADGRIYKLPMMAAILHVLNVSLPSPQALQSIDASFLMMGNHVDVNPISLRGGDIELVGAGSLSTSDYSVNLNLANVNPRRWARIPMLADFVEGASRELVGIQVTGPIGHPTVRTRPLGGLSDEFKRLFQKRQSPLVRQAAP